MHNAILIPKLKHHFQSSPPVFPLGNIGGVPAGQGVETTEGLENTGSRGNRVRPPLPYVLPHIIHTAKYSSDYQSKSPPITNSG